MMLALRIPSAFYFDLWPFVRTTGAFSSIWISSHPLLLCVIKIFIVDDINNNHIRILFPFPIVGIFSLIFAVIMPTLSILDQLKEVNVFIVEIVSLLRIRWRESEKRLWKDAEKKVWVDLWKRKGESGIRAENGSTTKALEKLLSSVLFSSQ